MLNWERRRPHPVPGAPSREKGAMICMSKVSAMRYVSEAPECVARRLAGGMDMSMSDYASYIDMLSHKPFLTKQEAVELFDIGINRIDELVRTEGLDFVTREKRVGNRKIHRESFERYILEHGVYGEV